MTRPAETAQPAVPPANLLASYAALLHLLHPVRRLLLTCASLSAAAAVAGLLPYIAIAEIARLSLTTSPIDDAASDIWRWVVITATGAAVRLVLLFFSSRVGHVIDARTLHHLRLEIVRHLGLVPLGWFRRHGSGAVKKALTNDLEDLHHLIAHALGQVIGAAVVTIVGVSYLLWVDWRMGLTTVAILLGLALAFRRAMRAMSFHMQQLLQAETAISTASIEYADGIAVVKTFGSGGRVLQRFSDAVSTYARALHRWAVETRHSTAISYLLAAELTVLGALMLIGLLLVRAEQTTMTAILPALIVGIGLPTAINPAVSGSMGIRKGRLAAGNILSVLQQATLPESATPQRPEGHALDFDHVSFSYTNDDGALALADVLLHCPPGTVTALVGPSGAGKTTLASLVPRFYDVSAGAIRLGGVDIRTMSSSDLLGRMALVFQDVTLLNDTVLENIRIGRPGATLHEVQAAARAAQIHDVLERLPQGYDTILGEHSGLSGGERQRLTIARALLSNAPIVVLDEATASVDPDSQTAIQQALAELTAGRTVLVIAHRLATIARADQIVVLDHGRIVECGTHADLLRRDGLYTRLWHAQTDTTPLSAHARSEVAA